MSQAFVLPPEAMEALAQAARDLTRIQSRLPEYLWIDTSIHVLTSSDGEKPGLDDKAAIGVLEFGDFGEYWYMPFPSLRARVKTA